MSYIDKLIGGDNGPKVTHDHICKHFLSQEEIVQSFLKLALTFEEQQTFELEQTHIERDSFESQRADMVFSVPLREKIGDLLKVYFLIEHKSYYDAGAIDQLMDYQYQLRKKLSKGGTRSSAVILVLFQHGGSKASAKWNRLLWPSNPATALDMKQRLSERIRSAISIYGIILIDPQDPRVMLCLAEPDCLCRGVVILLDRVNNTDKLPVQEAAAIVRDDFASFFKVQTQSQIDNHVGWIAGYLRDSGGYEPQDLKKLEELLIKYRVIKKMKDIKEYYTRLGLEEGLKEGRQEGRQEERQQIVVNMLEEKLDISIISKVTGLPEGEIQQVGRLNGANNLR